MEGGSEETACCSQKQNQLTFTFVSSKAEQRNYQAYCNFNIFTSTTNFLYFPSSTHLPSSISPSFN